MLVYKLYDGVDYVLVYLFVLYGYYFVLIVGVGLIVGFVVVMVWGWLLGLIWVWFGNVFIGVVYDYFVLMLFVCYDGKFV